MDSQTEDLPIYAKPIEVAARQQDKNLTVASGLLSMATTIDVAIINDLINYRFLYVSIAEAVIAGGLVLRSMAQIRNSEEAGVPG